MTKTYTPQQFLEFYTFLPKITDSLPTADENKRQYPIDFMLERRISHPWTTVSYWCRQQIFENNPQFNKIIGLNNGNLNNLPQISVPIAAVVYLL